MSALTPRAARVAAVALAATVSLSMVSPASAATSTVHDPSGPAAPGADLQSATVTNAAENVRIALEFRDLVRVSSSASGAAVFLDTDGKPGPEYVIGTGLTDGTDYHLSRTSSWNLGKMGPQTRCAFPLRLDYATDTVKIRVGKDCLKDPDGDGAVRVEVRTGGQRADGSQVTDWLGKARTFGATIAED